MDPINRAERNASILNFILVYILITAIPVGVTYSLTRKAGGSGGGSQKAVVEQQSLANEMTALQAYVKKMEDLDTRRPSETSSKETWNLWILEAEKQNNDFRGRVDQFQKNNAFTGARLTMRDDACSYLYRVNIERRNYLSKRSELLDERNDTAETARLRSENQQLANEKSNLQTQMTMLSVAAMKTPPPPAAGGGGGGGGSAGGGGGNKEMAEMKWQLQFCDANSQKTQADLLGNYNEVTRRKQLYTTARQSLQQLSQSAKGNYVLTQMASDKIQDIDRAMRQL